MAGQGTNRWVVLLNRSPKGPLTEEEVRTLLERGLLRANDIAYLVSDSVEKGKSEWKLLWQFPEFNRRQAGSTGTAEAPPDTTLPPETPQPTVTKDRRAKTPPEEIQQKAIAELPPDLMDISPEDLLPRSTQVNFKAEPAQITPMGDDSLLHDKPEVSGSSFQFDIRWAYGAGAVALLTLITFKLPDFLQRPVDKNQRTPTSHTASETGAGPLTAAPVTKPVIDRSRLKVTPPQTQGGAPSAREAAESRYDAPLPPPPPEEEPRVEEEGANDEAAEPNPTPPVPKNPLGRPPTTEEETNGPSVESEPATPENEGAPTGLQDENGESARAD